MKAMVLAADVLRDRSRPRARGLLVLGGTAAAVLLVELTLQAASWGLRLRLTRAGGNGGGPDPGAIRVLCIGESTTAPILEGDRDYSWPAQLQEILKTDHSGPPIQVINKGVPGTNTNVILARLPAYLDEYQPNVVIAMMGVNDMPYYGILEYKTGLSGAFWRLMARARTWKLLRYLWNETPSLADWARRRGVGSQARDAETHARLADTYAIRGNPKAGPEAETAYRLGTCDEQALLVYAGYLLKQGRTDELNAMLPMAIARTRAMGNGQDLLTDFWRGRNGYRAWTADFLYQAKVDPMTVRRVALIVDGSASAMNYLKMASLLEQRGIRLVAMQYPGLDAAKLRLILRHFPRTTFVETKRIFDRALEDARYENYFKDHFAGSWGHCTAKGNRLIAQAAASALRPLLRERRPTKLGASTSIW